MEEKENTPPEPWELQHTLKLTVEDLVGQLLYYGRKEDEDLPMKVSNECWKNGTFTVDQTVAMFKEALEKGLKQIS